jgi:hypothetical protein
MELLLKQQIVEHLNKYDLLCPVQSNFRAKHSTTTALLRVSDDNNRGLDSNIQTVLALLDFSRAFDTVNHKCLLQKLRLYFNFSDLACRLMSSYLIGRKQRVYE